MFTKDYRRKSKRGNNMNPKDILDVVDVVSKGIDILKEAKKFPPENQYVEIQAVLTSEETRLLNQLREGGPCVICGCKGSHVTEEVQICKFVNEVKSGILFWKKNTHGFVRRSLVAPLCSRHYQEAEAREKVENKLGCATVIFSLVGAALTSYLMLQLKRQGHCVMPVNDVLTVIFWFVVGFILSFVAGAVLFGGVIQGIFFRELDGYAKFESIWKCGPLKWLLELNWIKCGKDVGEKQLKELMAKAGEYVS